MGCGLCQAKGCQLVSPLAGEDPMPSETLSMARDDPPLPATDRPKLFTVGEEPSSLEESVRTFRRLESRIRENSSLSRIN